MPEQLMSMVTKIKEATIDVGPQPVKYSKFIEVPLYQLAKLIPEEQLQQFKQSLEESKGGSLGARHQSSNLNKNECQGGQIPNTKVNCLIISTDIAFEIWLIKHQSLISGQMDIECIYRKKEDGIDLIDYLHLIETNQNIVDHNAWQNNQFEQNKNDYQNSDSDQFSLSRNQRYRVDSDDQFFNQDEEGIYDEMTPLVGYTTIQNTCLLKIYSLKCDKTLHVFRFNSPLTKFLTNINSNYNQLIVLLQEGLLKIFNLSSLEQEISLKTFNFNPQQGLSSSQSYESQLLAAAFLLDFDMSHNLYAYVYNEINESDLISELNKNVDQSLLGQYFLTKEATKQLIQFGHSSINKMVNLMNVQKAAMIDSNQLQTIVYQQAAKQNLCTCKKQTQSQIIAAQASRNVNNVTCKSQNSAIQNSKVIDSLAGSSMQLLGAGLGNQRRSRVNSDQIQDDPSLKPLQQFPTITKENLISVRVRDLNDSKLFVEIKPPFFKNISLVRFSPSGRYLVLGNENCQYFYIYEILPQTNQRFKNCCANCHQDRVRLRYSLFRGYTAAQVTDIQFVSVSQNLSDLEQILIINSSNGTSHIYNLKIPKKLNETPIQKTNQEDIYHQKVHVLTAKSRFKYKSIIQQGEIKIVSIISMKQNQNGNLNSDDQKCGMNYRILTYTSKNEFYVIDASKLKTKQVDGVYGREDDSSIVQENDSEEENSSSKGSSHSSQTQKQFTLDMVENFQLNLATQSFHKIPNSQLPQKFINALPHQIQKKKNKIQNQEWLKEIEAMSFYPQMQLNQNLNPNLNFAESTKDFLRSNKTEKSYFDYDLTKQLCLVNRQKEQQIDQNLINFNYSYQSQFTVTMASMESNKNQDKLYFEESKFYDILGADKMQFDSSNDTNDYFKHSNKLGQSLHDYVIEDGDYFGGQSIIRQQSDEEDHETSKPINLSEYLDQTYNKFNADYKIRHEEDEDDTKDFRA